MKRTGGRCCDDAGGQNKCCNSEDLHL
jgi:hypothetical protein